MGLIASLAASAFAAVLCGPNPNIALGRPYALAPVPGYALCTDPGDSSQLTDGRRVAGYFWAQRGAVGWAGASGVQITVDLGEPRPIAGAAFSTAAGAADVAWPVAIELWVSDDAKDWWSAGDLVALDALENQPAPVAGYATHTFRTDRLRERGRYVAFFVVTESPYAFCDEVEVYGGRADQAAPVRHGAPVRDIAAGRRERRTLARVRLAVAADIDAVAGEIDHARLRPQERARLRAALDAARREAAALALAPGFRAIIPFAPVHGRVFSVRAALLRETGARSAAWVTGPWDRLLPGEGPPSAGRGQRLAITMLREEERGTALNLRSVSRDGASFRLAVSGATGPGAPRVAIERVVWTATASGEPVACALLPASDGLIEAAPGLTCQAWLRVSSAGARPGVHRCQVAVIQGRRMVARIALSVRISRAAMPSRLALSLGGWDYSDAPALGVTDATLPAFVAFLQRYRVDAPWATPSVMPFGSHDAEGQMIRAPDTAAMDRWLERWPAARFRFVYAALEPSAVAGDAARRRLSDWAGFWARHIRSRGVPPEKVGLLLVDEPRDTRADHTIAEAASVISAAAPGFIIFEDPTWEDPGQAGAAMLGAATLLCPNRTAWQAKRGAYERVYLPLQAAGKRLAFYSCSGPVRDLDPYAYHRLQAWDCFRYGMDHEGFWAFGDNGGADSWNELARPGAGYSPAFVGPEGITTSKHMEAVREGLFDHQTLTLLREAADRAAGDRRLEGEVAAARGLLATGPAAVTDAALSIWWRERTDRGLADRVRSRAIELLDRLVR